MVENVPSPHPFPPKVAEAEKTNASKEPDLKSSDPNLQSLEPYSDLKRRVEITRDARFQANLRLERRQKSSYFAISILSLFVIVLSLIPNIFSLSEQEAQALLALTIVNSVFVIITTFLEASGNFVHKGEQLHRSARQIAKVFNQLMLLTPAERVDSRKIHDLQEKYQEALDDCLFNHDNLDYDLIKTTKPYLFSGRIYSGRFGFLVNVYRKVVYRLTEYSWLLPHAALVFASMAVVYWITVGGGFVEGELPAGTVSTPIVGEG